MGDCVFKLKGRSVPLVPPLILTTTMRARKRIRLRMIKMGRLNGE